MGKRCIGLALLALAVPAWGDAYSDLVVSHGPAAYWRLGGTATADSSGNSFTLSQGGTTGQTGALLNSTDAAVRYQAALTQAAATSTSSGLQPGSGSFTAEAWFCTSADGPLLTWHPYGESGDAGAKAKFGLESSVFSIQDSSGNTASCALPTSAADGQWHHLAAVLDRTATTLTLYLDGTAANSASIVTLGDVSSLTSYVVRLGVWYHAGAGSGNVYYDGQVDEAALYTKALTADQVKQHHRTGRQPLKVWSTGDTGAGTLREAISYANSHTGADTVSFDLPESPTIALSSSLTLSGDSTTIDGYTQTSAAANTATDATNASLQVAVTCATSDAFVVSASTCVLKGLVVRGCGGSGISISGSSNSVLGCFIGTNNAGTAAAANTGSGVRVVGAGNTIGGSAPADRNLISGNGADGIVLTSAASGNTICGNVIGLRADGLAALANTKAGVAVYGPNNTTGGSATVPGRQSGNVVSGNGAGGIELNGASATGNQVRGNVAGLGCDRATVIPNTNSGVMMYPGASSNTVGGATADLGNLLAGNTECGISIGGSAGSVCTGNTVAGNRIGLSLTDQAKPNVSNGIWLGPYCQDTTIGGTASTAGAAPGNIIAGNTWHGVHCEGVSHSGTTIQGNLIGLAGDGTTPLANLRGIWLGAGTSGNTVGGTTAGQGNIIAGNTDVGVAIDGNATNPSTNHLVQGNRIGLNAANVAKANGITGVNLTRYAQNNTIGGNTSVPGTGAGNTISGNGGNGIVFAESGNTSNKVQGNLIGLGGDGSTVVANGANGVLLRDDSSATTIGGSTAGDGNVIAGNTTNGVCIVGSAGHTSSGHFVRGNRIGLTTSGAARPNGYHGVWLDTYSQNNTIGGTTATPGVAPGNIISGNTQAGVACGGAGTTNNSIQGNVIGLTADGGTAVPNHLDGVDLWDGSAGHTVGGATAGQGNVIAGNAGNGIGLGATASRSCTGHSIQGNRIGLSTNDTVRANGGQGIWVGDYCSNHTIGGTGAAANVISGNAYNGVALESATCTGVTIAGNYIGTNAAGTAARPNGVHGVHLAVGAHDNTVGGAGLVTVISGNTSAGVCIDDTATTANTIVNCLVGTNAAGTAAVPNYRGVVINSGTANTVGGATVAARCLVSGNTDHGILIGSVASGNTVAGNLVGLRADGLAALGNGNTGIWVEGGSNTIGGSTTTAGTPPGNVASGNAKCGIVLCYGTATGNQVSGNLVGLASDGTVAANGNHGVGVYSGASTNTIGGATAGLGNLIAGNTWCGIGVSSNEGTTCSSNTVVGNRIGIDASGAAKPNSQHGVYLSENARNNTVGGAGAAANLISGNGMSGVALDNANCTGNTVAGNFIGTNAAGNAAVPNTSNGVGIYTGAHDNTIGGTGLTTVISGNGASGVAVTGATSTGNKVICCRIGTDVTGTIAVPNKAGVYLADGASATVGDPTLGLSATPLKRSGSVHGSALGRGNVIAYNVHYGIWVRTGAGTGSNLRGNSIYGNGEIGIDLGEAGVTPNDADDADTGPNNLQNYPVLTGAWPVSGGLRVTGTLDSVNPHSAYPVIIDFYRNTTADASGHGQADEHLGALAVVAPGQFATDLSAVSPGQQITAMATDSNNNTSELSRAFAASGDASQLAFAVQPASGTAGQTLPAAKVAVQDAAGNLCAAPTTITLALANNAGGGTLSGTLTASTVDGIATFSSLSLDKVGTGYTLQATAAGLTSATSAGLDIHAAGATQLVWGQQPANTSAGQPFSAPVTVKLADAFGNLVGSATNSVTIALGHNPGASTLTGTATVAAVNGVATFADLSLNKVGTGYTLTAAATGLTGATSAGFDIVHNSAAKLVFDVQPHSTSAGAALSPAVTVRLLDSSDNLVTAATNAVTLALGTNPGGGTLSGTTTSNAVGGVATFADLAVDKAATGYTLTAAAGGLTGATSTAFDITAGAAARLVFAVGPSNTSAGQAIAPAVTVRVVDAAGNLVASATPTISLALAGGPAGAGLHGTTSAAAVNGTATFSDLSLQQAATGYTLTAAAGGLSGTTSTAFDITAAAVDAQQSTLTAAPQRLLANGSDAAGLTVAAKDAYGNPCAGLAANQVVLACTTTPAADAGLVLVQPTAVTDASGRSTGSLSASRPQAVTVQATVAGVRLHQTATVTFTPRPISAEQSTVVLTPARIAADGQEVATLQVLLRDAGGAPVEGSPADQRTLTGDGLGDQWQVGSLGATSGADGRCEVTVTASTAGQYPLTLTVGDVALPPVTLTALSYIALDVPAGLRFVSLPLVPDGERLAALLAHPGVQVARYDPVARQYVTITVPAARGFDPAAAGLTAGVGLWLRSEQAFTLNLTGTPVPATPWTMSLAQGWNAVGNPFGNPLPWTLSEIRVLVDGSDVGALSDERLWAGTILPYGWVWRSDSLPGYRLVFDPSRPGFAQTLGEVAVLDGLWVRAVTRNVSLRLPAPAAARSRRGPRHLTPRDWAVDLLATSGHGQGRALFGVSSGLTRALAIAEPPGLEAAGPVQLKLLQSAGDERLAGLVQAPEGGEQVWQAEASSAGADAVTLSWPSLLRTTPRGLVVSLTDQQSGQTLLLNTHSSYRYTPSRAGEARRFKLSARFGHLERPEITGLSLTATRGRSASLSLTLSGPARITVTVRGLGGRVVKELSQTATAAGTLTLSWDGTDREGRKVPAGSYLIEAVATADNGAQSRATRTVRVP